VVVSNCITHRAAVEVYSIHAVACQHKGPSNESTTPRQFSWGGGLYLEGRWPVTLTNNAIYDNRVTTAGAGLLIAHCAPLLLHK